MQDLLMQILLRISFWSKNSWYLLPCSTITESEIILFSTTDPLCQDSSSLDLLCNRMCLPFSFQSFSSWKTTCVCLFAYVIINSLSTEIYLPFHYGYTLPNMLNFNERVVDLLSLLCKNLLIFPKKHFDQIMICFIR